MVECSTQEDIKISAAWSAVNDLSAQVESPPVLMFNDTPTLDQILRLQESMLEHQTAQPEPIHRFAPGVYLRELTVPAGMLIVGKTHKHAHFLIVMSGKAEVLSEFGRGIVEAGHVSVSQPGAKRIVLAIEDTRFLTIHHNKEDSENLELIESTHIEFEEISLTAKKLLDEKMIGELQ